MFTIKADFIRLAIGAFLFSLDFWLFEVCGALLLMCVLVNFVIHACQPQLIKNATANYTADVNRDTQLALIRGATVTQADRDKLDKAVDARDEELLDRVITH